MLQKLKSRKFITAIVGIILGIAMIFGLDANTITQVAGALTALVSVVTYIRTEGKIDAAAVNNAIDSIKEAVDSLGREEN